MKYVMFTNRKVGASFPVLSSNHLTHSDMKAGPGMVPTSAGFFDIKTCRTFGESDSLGLKPAKTDAEVLMCVIGNMDSSIMLPQDFDKNLEAVREADNKARLQLDKLVSELARLQAEEDLEENVSELLSTVREIERLRLQLSEVEVA